MKTETCKYKLFCCCQCLTFVKNLRKDLNLNHAFMINEGIHYSYGVLRQSGFSFYTSDRNVSIGQSRSHQSIVIDKSSLMKAGQNNRSQTKQAGDTFLKKTDLNKTHDPKEPK